MGIEDATTTSHLSGRTDEFRFAERGPARLQLFAGCRFVLADLVASVWLQNVSPMASEAGRTMG